MLELRGIDVEIRFSRRDCNISDIEPQEHSNDCQIPHGIFKPTGKCEADGKSTSVGLFTMGDYKK